jgi:hypothetical protein
LIVKYKDSIFRALLKVRINIKININHKRFLSLSMAPPHLGKLDVFERDFFQDMDKGFGSFGKFGLILLKKMVERGLDRALPK